MKQRTDPFALMIAVTFCYTAAPVDLAFDYARHLAVAESPIAPIGIGRVDIKEIVGEPGRRSATDQVQAALDFNSTAVLPRAMVRPRRETGLDDIATVDSATSAVEICEVAWERRWQR